MAKDKKSKCVFDAAGFEADLKAARDASKPSQAEEEKHLATLELWTTLLGVTGLILAVRGTISPLAMIALGYYKYAKFAIVAHHSLHGAWGLQRRGWFAQGVYRRIIDWLDWIFPMAWIIEHNKVHHYYLNEDADPDYVQRNTEKIHAYDIPVTAKYAIVAVQSTIWKWWYYASNTLKTMHADKPGAPSKAELDDAITMTTLMYKLDNPWYRELAKDFTYIMAPNFLITFVLIPMLGGVFRWNFSLLPFCWITLINVMGAEAITNVHAFCTIVTNHAGSDLWSWNAEKAMPDTAEFYIRATLGSVAYHAGNDFVDYFHGYLNYQCEHHAFPSISPLHYQRLHPLYKKVCAKHGVPYIQEPMWVRVKKTADIIAGVAKHKHMVGNCVDQPELWMCEKSKDE